MLIEHPWVRAVYHLLPLAEIISVFLGFPKGFWRVKGGAKLPKEMCFRVEEIQAVL